MYLQVLDAQDQGCRCILSAEDRGIVEAMFALDVRNVLILMSGIANACPEKLVHATFFGFL